uniref:syndecan-4-like n=1 Tax=Myxine glutinosa TaxID=7769 RepID=UPI00358E458F
MGLLRTSWILGFLLIFHATAESFQSDLGEGSGSGDVGLIDDEDGSGSGYPGFDSDDEYLPDNESENDSDDDLSDEVGDDRVEEDDIQVDNRLPDGSGPDRKPSPGMGWNDEDFVKKNEIAPNAANPVDKNMENAIAAKVQSSAQGSSLQRTEVLAAIIAGGVVGLLMAIALIAFLVLRMRKKEEGNCIVGKNAEPAYQRANTEIYA